MPGRRLAHGYTNQSWIEEARVVKHYDGVDGEERLRTEVAVLVRAGNAVPVPEVVEVDPGRRQVSLTFMAGRHGQELIDEGFATKGSVGGGADTPAASPRGARHGPR